MQLEELEKKWQRLDHKLDQSLQLQTDLLRHAVLQPARRRINRFAVWPAIDIGFSIGVLSLAGSFLRHQWSDWTLVIPAVGIMVGAIALMIASIRQLVYVSELDWSGPVADIQCSLEKLRAAKIRQFKWIILLSPLVGFCALIVGVAWLSDAIADFNLVEKFNGWWVVGNYAFGVLFIPVGWIVARIVATRFHGRGWWQRFLDDIAGNSLQEAQRELSHWSHLQRE